ncbi:heat shock protein transcriptional repressor HspR [Nesterenkonia sp. LB17]|uniref:heat shock protein transcriptional repressor HspR n=2 Tax=Nesterenkonia TaxID=57494 RepID=UPI00272BC954|nr:MerR family transcriptional regulator [Nesterenkonia sp. LB17]
MRDPRILDSRMLEPEHRHAPMFVISVAAELADMHPQTLRQYDRIGLVTPRRQGGRHRRYSPYNIEQLRQIQQFSQDGVSLEGIRRILDLQNRVEVLEETVDALRHELRESQRHSTKPRFFAVGPHGDVVTVARGRRARANTQALVLWEPGPRRR